MILSNGLLAGVRDAIRSNALESFEYFSNTVLTYALSDSVCSEVQEIMDTKEDAFIECRRPRVLGLALVGWLTSHGVKVLTGLEIPQGEVLRWLEFHATDTSMCDQSVVVDVLQNGVRVQWL